MSVGNYSVRNRDDTPNMNACNDKWRPVFSWNAQVPANRERLLREVRVTLADYRQSIDAVELVALTTNLCDRLHLDAVEQERLFSP